MSPGFGSPNLYPIFSTTMRSPVQPVQPCKVGSIDSDGIRYTRATNVWSRKLSTSATRIRMGSSRQNDRGLRSRRFFPEDSSSGSSVGSCGDCVT